MPNVLFMFLHWQFQPFLNLYFSDAADTIEGRNILVNTLVRQLIAYIRFVVNNGSSIFNIPVLDPLDLEHYHLHVPAGIVKWVFIYAARYTLRI